MEGMDGESWSMALGPGERMMVPQRVLMYIGAAGEAPKIGFSCIRGGLNAIPRPEG